LGVDPAVESNRLKERGVYPSATEFGIADEWLDAKAVFTASEPAEVWRAPIETVSLSEAGFERSYQGTALIPVWKLSLAPEETWRVSLELQMAGVRELARV